jgi:hypothetical protein
MKKRLLLFLVLSVVCLCGCEGLRYGVSEAQKENALAHRAVCEAAAEQAVREAASEELCGLTELAHEQSGAFVADYGVPRDLSLLSEPGQAGLDRAKLYGVADEAIADSVRRPNVWVLADGAMELGIGLAGLIGGVYGLRITGFLKQAREKSKALKEVVEGNELFKQLYPEQAERFKESHSKQSSPTRRLVSSVKAG